MKYSPGTHLLAILFVSISFTLQSQQVVRGVILDANNGEALIGANVSVAGTAIGTSTEWDGSFQFRTEASYPLTLVVTYIGYEEYTGTFTEPGEKIEILLIPSNVIIEGIEVTSTRITDKRRESPLTVESLDLIAIRETPSNDFYEGLGSLKGVDLTTASMGFTIINTRGFNSTSPVRSLQIIDGVDNQSPGLNFSLGNFLGAPELDVLRVELIQGASSAYYGPNAFNGVIDIRTKDPFIHQGLSASVKFGERNLFGGMVRYAKAFQNRRGQDKFAFKINAAFFRADDWQADNLDPTLQSDTTAQNPGGYDAVNIYGDENIDLSRDATDPVERFEFPGLEYFHRRGYLEADLVDYKTENYKGNFGLFYNITPDIRAQAGMNFGSGTTVYQGDNRFRLENIFFMQGKVQVEQEGKFFIRGYFTSEDAGDSYDIYSTALDLQLAAKSEGRWTSDYKQFWRTFIQSRVKGLEGYPTGFPFDFEQQARVLAENRDSLIRWHALAQAAANEKSPAVDNLPFFEPGTQRFEEQFALITGSLANDPDGGPGTKFYDRSALYHLHGEYTLETGFADFTLGGNYRLYRPDSRGTIFSDTLGRKITNSEFGFYAGVDKKLIPTKLKLNATLRVDKNENFNAVMSPAASLVYTPNIDNTFRISFSSALRNPTLSDQYLFLDVGRAQLLGNISGYEDLVTPESLIDFLNSRDPDTLVYFDEPPIQPEQVRTIEFGYRGMLFGKLWLDMEYYYSWYDNFIGYRIGADIEYDPFTNFLTAQQVLRISTNAQSRVTTQGLSVGMNYYFNTYFNASGNYSWNVLNKSGTDDPIIPAFNTPEHKFNIGLSGRGFPINLFGARLNGLGFNINYKWIEGFLFEGSPQFTGEIPTYDLLDAQINWHISSIGTTIKFGASNVLDKKQFQTYGGPRIGRMAYLSITYESRN